MNRSSLALFLTTLAIAGSTLGCSQAPEAGGEGSSDTEELRSPNQGEDHEGGEGGEGGEG